MGENTKYQIPNILRDSAFFESASGACLKRSDFFRLLSGRHFDVWVYSLDEIVLFPPLPLCADAAGGPIVQTAAQHETWRAWVVEAHKVCFRTMCVFVCVCLCVCVHVFA